MKNKQTAASMAAVYELVARVNMLTVQHEAMKVENELALRRGSHPPYRDNDFYALAREFAEIAQGFKSLREHVPPAMAG